MQSLREFLDQIIETVRLHWDRHPEGILALILAESTDEQFAIPVVLPPSEDALAEFEEKMRLLFLEKGVHHYALVLPSVKLPKNVEVDGDPLKHPDAREIVVIVVRSRSDVMTAELPVDSARRLGAVEYTQAEGLHGLTGPMTDLFRGALN